MYWARIDNRLVHGQIIESWLPFTGAGVLMVVNDQLKGNPIQQEIISLAIPPGVEALFTEVGQAPQLLKKYSTSTALVLFSTCKDAHRAYEGGLNFPSINVGNLHYTPGKRQLCPHVALSSEDEDCLRYLKDHGVQLDFRCVPNDPVQVKGF